MITVPVAIVATIPLVLFQGLDVFGTFVDGALVAVVIMSWLSRLSDDTIILGVSAVGSVVVPLPGWDIFNAS